MPNEPSFGKPYKCQANIKIQGFLLNSYSDDPAEAISLLEKMQNAVRTSSIFTKEMIEESVEEKEENTPVEPEVEAPLCPYHKEPMDLKEGKNGKFWGCKHYPTCKRTVDYK